MYVFFPVVGYWSDLELVRSESSSRSGNRLTNVVEFADPLWMANVQTSPMLADEFQAFEAWKDSLRGALRPVVYRHPDYAAPLAHRHAPGPERQAGTVSFIEAGNVVHVTGCNPALVLRAGDLLTFEQGGLRGLGRVTGAAGSGGTRVVTIEPSFPRHLSVGATVRFDRAELIMRMVPGSWSKSRVQQIAWEASFQLMESRV